MLVLGIESSCDETGCAVVRAGREILSNEIASQLDLHAPFGGVVPELASRYHVEVISQLLDKALLRSQISLQDIGLIAVASEPGLIGSLFVGVNFAKGLALSLPCPLVGVNHVAAHLHASMMGRDVPLPALGVVLSGGHTALFLLEEHRARLIGETQDDAIGEVFDKVATFLGCPYPGGPEIERLAKSGDRNRFAFKAGLMKNRPYDFSFSGLKTAVLYLVKGQNSDKNAPSTLHPADFPDVAASFQHTAFLSVVNKSSLAAKEHQCKSVVVGGGVSQNKALRTLFGEKMGDLPLFYPQEGLCLDNGAMIAALGYKEFMKRGEKGDPLNFEPRSRTTF